MSTEIAGIVIAKGSAHPVDRFEVGRLVFGAYVPVARALGMEEAAAVDVLPGPWTWSNATSPGAVCPSSASRDWSSVTPGLFISATASSGNTARSSAPSSTSCF